MEIPFTLQQYFNVFKTYNEKVYPMQVFLNAFAVIAVYYIIKQKPKSSMWISAILALFWLWMGFVYQLNFFAPLNKLAMLFGLLFIVQAVLFFIYGVVKKQITFRFRSDAYGLAGISMILYALVIYPLIGFTLGHVYPIAPTFGVPGPTTIFTLGLLLFIEGITPLILLVIPFVWSIAGFYVSLNFGMREDTGLLIAGVITIPLILFRNKKGVQGEEVVKHSIVALVVAVIIAGCFLIYKNTDNDIPKYNEKMNLFTYNESKALEFYRLSPKMPKEKLLSSIKNKGLFYWSENIKLVKEADQLNLPVLFHERNEKMLQYCDLRIKSYQLIYKSIDENTTVYSDSIELYKARIKELMKSIKAN